jgi:hypothetical protein
MSGEFLEFEDKTIGIALNLELTGYSTWEIIILLLFSLAFLEEKASSRT